MPVGCSALFTSTGLGISTPHERPYLSERFPIVVDRTQASETDFDLSALQDHAAMEPSPTAKAIC
jgi:hypothetical protein